MTKEEKLNIKEQSDTAMGIKKVKVRNCFELIQE